MGLFAFNRARRQAQEAAQPDAPAAVQLDASAQEAAQPDAPAAVQLDASAQEAAQPDAAKHKRAKTEKTDGAKESAQ